MLSEDTDDVERDISSVRTGSDCTLTPVRAAPQVSDYLVDLVHLHAVELHDCSEENKQTSELSSWWKHQTESAAVSPDQELDYSIGCVYQNIKLSIFI